MVTLEALQARKGDALLLRREAGDSSALIIIDGGAAGVFRLSLQPRLDALRRELQSDDPEPPSLRVDLMIVSHIDDDHIAGLLELTDHLIDQPQVGNLDYKIRVIWHNSFEAIAQGAAAGLASVTGDANTASIDNTMTELNLSTEGALVVVSIPQGRRLADNARRLDIASNVPWKGPIVADTSLRDLQIAEGVKATVLCPNAEQIRQLEMASAKVKGADKATAAAFVDEEVTNLSSIVVLVESDGKTMLLTGDARGDHILDGAREMGIISDLNPTRQVDVLKVPHHGSNRSNGTALFDTFPADHYVISGNGEHGNPDPETVRALIASRRRLPGHFTLYLTYAPEDYRPFRGKPYPVDDLRAVLQDATDDGVLSVVTPMGNERGVLVAP